MRKKKRLPYSPWCVPRHFWKTECPLRAAALAFELLLAWVPLTVIALTVFSAFPHFSKAQQHIQHFILSHFVATSAQVIEHHLSIFVHQASRLSTIGLCFLLCTAILLMLSLEGSFNRIWGIEHNRKGIQAFVLYWTVLTLLPVAAGAVLMVPHLVHTWVHIPPLPPVWSWATPFVLWITPYLLTCAFLTWLYVGVPNRKVPFKPALSGAVVATVLFDCAKKVFMMYVTHFPTYQLVYGAMAAVPLFLIWLYLALLIILLGVTISAVLSRKR